MQTSERVSKKESYEKPKSINPRNVVYWAEKEGLLIGNQKSKARKFIELGCVLPTSNKNLWVVKHIEGYNLTNHQVDIQSDKCSCQFSKKMNGICSHILAVKLYKFMMNWNGINN